MAYNEHVIGIHRPVGCAWTKELGDESCPCGARTAGRIIFNQQHPSGSGLCGPLNDPDAPMSATTRSPSTCGKKQLGKIVDRTHQASTASPSPPRCWTPSRPPGYQVLHHGRHHRLHRGHDRAREEVRTHCRDRAARWWTSSDQYKHGLHHRRRALQAGGAGVGKDHQRRHRRPAGQPGPATTPSS